ncbi:DUF5060 domain-containing protein [Rubrolithibacter danxiaensis]|uniref:DUF5060 domain-containing protein n=1 Tax=Rubrolithibacter danxiaensis TaxID=3390805 RepID=UPI003BF7F92C
MRKFIVSILSLLLCCTLYAQNIEIKPTLINSLVLQYKKAEWNIILNKTFINPYNQKEVSLDLILTSPSGKPLYLPCYFEAADKTGKLWKARFTPQEAGLYTYNFRLTEQSGITETPVSRFNVQQSKAQGFLHKNDLWTFKFDNGNLFRGIGENVGWESRSFENDKWTYDYLLPSLSKNGANFFRTWMCYWNLPLEWKKVNHTKRYSDTDNYFNPGAIRRMDELVNMCDSLNLYFMLTLDWHGHLMQEGGWKNSPYNQKNGGPAKTPAEFFTLQSSQQKYKDKLRYVVARWGYSTNIAAWEFFNEIDNAAYTAADSILIPHDAIAQWHNEMSRYLKDIDPYNHMVTTSISHRDIMGLNSIPYIDFNQKHIYKRTERIPSIYPQYIETFNKPYVVGEFGFRWEDDNPEYGEGFDFDYKRGLWYGLFSPTPVLPMSWWWELFDNRNMTPYFNSVKEISDKMLKAGKGSFEQIPVNAGIVEAMGVKCGRAYFVYLLNNTGSAVNTTVSLNVRQENIGIIQSFNPSSRTYNQLQKTTITDKEVAVRGINLPAKKELILILKPKE